MPLPPPKHRTAYGTYLYFAEPGALETFIRDYRRILMDNFQNVKIEGGLEYWSCCQDHDSRNWNWKPWHHLERLCLKQGLDDFAVRDIIVEHLEGSWNASARFYMMRGNCGRRLLRGSSGLILTVGRSGWWIETELQNRFRLDYRFGFGMLTADDGMSEISGRKRKMGLWTEDRASVY